MQFQNSAEMCTKGAVPVTSTKSSGGSSSGTIPSIHVQELKCEFSKYAVIDCREESEFKVNVISTLVARPNTSG